MAKKKPSYSCLKETVRCANDEAQGYLNEAIDLRIQVASLRDDLDVMTTDRDRWQSYSQRADRLTMILVRALEDAQKQVSI